MFSFDSFLPLRREGLLVSAGVDIYYDFEFVPSEEIWYIETVSAEGIGLAATRTILFGAKMDGVYHGVYSLLAPANGNAVAYNLPFWVLSGERLFYAFLGGVAAERVDSVISGKIYKECKK